MSSDFYPSSLSRNLIRTGAFGYRENVALGILNRAEDAAARQRDQRFEAIGNFVAFPDFSRGPQAGRGTNARRIHSLGQLHVSTLAASLDKRSGIGPLPL
jgi:hypothetical protein